MLTRMQRITRSDGARLFAHTGAKETGVNDGADPPVQPEAGASLTHCSVCQARLAGLGKYCCANLLSCPQGLLARPPSPEQIGKTVYTTVARRPDAHLRLLIARSSNPLPEPVLQELAQAPEPWVRQAIRARLQRG